MDSHIYMQRARADLRDKAAAASKPQLVRVSDKASERSSSSLSSSKRSSGFFKKAFSRKDKEDKGYVQL
jgi:hypothetical protein